MSVNRLIFQHKTSHDDPAGQFRFYPVLLIDGVPTYYKVYRRKTRFFYMPCYENLLEPLPSFTIWDDGHDWWIDPGKNDFPERYVVEQAVKHARILIEFW